MSAERQNEFSEFVKIIGEMSEDEIIALEKEKNKEAYLTKEDYPFLAARGYWTVDEACGFLLNIDKRRAVMISSGYTRTFGARYFEIFHAYVRCVNIGEFTPETIANQEALDHGVDDIRTIVVVPKDFLLWAKSKGLPIPPMLWSAVFTPEDFALGCYRDGNVESLVNSPISRPHALAIGNEQASDIGAGKAPSKNKTIKDPGSQKNGGDNYKGLTEFKKRVRQFILDEKERGCTCNHLRLAAFLKNVWESQEKKLFIDEKGKNLWEKGKHKEPTTYFVEICRKTYEGCHENISLEEKDKKWRIVKRMNIAAPPCTISQHNF